jgi:hypothetical protein
VNGVLVVAYLVIERIAHISAIAVALLIAATFDRLVQSQAVFAPRRYEVGALHPSQVPHTAQAITGLAIGLWLTATWSFQSLVPAIGAAMWVASLLALLVMPQQRWSLLWSTKAYLILYSVAVIGFRLYLWQSALVSPQNWLAQPMSVVGPLQGAKDVLATLRTRGNPDHVAGR